MYIGGYSTIQGSLTLVGNRAEGLGPSEACGAICVFVLRSSASGDHSVISALVISNHGTTGSALFIEENSRGINFTNITALNNSGGALGLLNAVVNATGVNIFSENVGERGVITITNSTVGFYGNNTFESNFATFGTIAIEKNRQVSFNGSTQFSNNIGGGVYAVDSSVVFYGSTVFQNNSRLSGGAIYTEGGKLSFSGNTLFTNNTAEYGGGLYASRESVYMQDTVEFSFNSAKRGGAMYLKLDTSLTLDWYTHLTTSANTVSEYGGDIYNKDSITTVQCTNVSNILHTDHNLALTIKESFLQISRNIDVPDFACPRINSRDDSAVQDGSFLYGGLLDRSRLPNNPTELPYDFFTNFCPINATSSIYMLI